MTSSETPPSQQDPFSTVKNEARTGEEISARRVNAIHKNSDVDSGPFSQHHTLGTQRNNSSPGDHVHDGKASKKVGSGLNLAISGSRGGNAAVASIITMLKTVINFTDNTTP